MNSILNSRRSTREKAAFFRVLQYQLATLVVLSLSGLLIDFVVAYSIFLGGLIFLLPTFYSAKKHFASKCTDSANVVLADMYLRQMWKMAFMALLFALIFVLVKPLSGFFLFASLFLMQLLNLIFQFKTTT